MVKAPPCPICTGKRRLCIHRSYPFPADFSLQKRISEKLRKDFYGPSYSVFVGREGYPDVNTGLMTGIESIPAVDNPSKWFGLEYTKIIELRSMLIRSKHRESIFSRSRFISEQQEIALASRPAYTEIEFRKTPVYTFRLSEFVQPMGPSGILEKMRITENVSIKSHVEKAVSYEMPAGEASFLLYRKGEDVYRISSILSSGALGFEANRKLVPSRWSTTASHDIVARHLLREIRQFPSVNEYRVYSSHFLDNHFEVLLMPGNWEFENFEVWAPGSNWYKQSNSRIISEYEPHGGRTNYAESQAGGYYASRLGVAEGLHKLGRQASAVVFREVYEGYTIPMGVWQVLENVRNAFIRPCMKFDTKEEALNYISKRLRIPASEYVKKSRVLGQKRLWEF